MKGKAIHTGKVLAIGIVALLLLSTVMLTTPISAKPIPPGFSYTVYVTPSTVNGSAVGGLGSTFTVELWSNTTSIDGSIANPGVNPGCYAYGYWFDWNDTLLELQSYSVFPPVDKWTLGIFTAADLLKDMDGNTKYDRHSYSVSALGVPAGWMDDRKIAEYTFVVAYQPIVPEPPLSCKLHIVDRGFIDVNGAKFPPGDLEDGTYEIFAGPPSTIPLTVVVSADPTTMYSGEASTITVSVIRTNDSTPVSGAFVKLSSNVTGGSFSSATDQGNGNYTSVFTAPIVSESTVVNVTAEASKTGYITGEGSTNVTVNPDTTPPVIGNPSRVPSGDVTAGQVVTVSVSVTDAQSGVKNVTLSYSLNNSTVPEDYLKMTYNSTSHLWQTTIRGLPYCKWVNYTIIAYDNAGNDAINNNLGEYFVYHVIPEFPSATIMTLLMIIISMLVVVFANKRLLRKPKS